MINKAMEVYLESLKLDSNLKWVIGIILQESSGRYVATRYEKKYKWLWDVQANAPFTFPEPTSKMKPAAKTSAAEGLPVPVVAKKKDVPPSTFKGLDGVTTALEEWKGQRTSWGPMQIMGAVAREYGFKGKFEELNTNKGIFYGVKHFQNLSRRFLAEHGISGVLSGYNDGDSNPANNQSYVDGVTKYANNYLKYIGG